MTKFRSAGLEVEYRNGAAEVSSDDFLVEAKKDPDCKKLLEIKPFLFSVNVPIGKVKDAELELDDKQVRQVGEAVKGIQKKLEKKLDGLIDDLKKLVRDDQAGSKKAAAEAEKRVEAVEKDLQKELPDIGRQVRKIVEDVLKTKLPGSIKSTASGSFKGLELVYEFAGDRETYTAQHKELGADLAEFKKELKPNCDSEKEKRAAYIKELKEYQTLVDKQKADDATAKTKFDERLFYQNNRTKADKVKRAGTEYVKHLNEFHKANEESAKDLDAKDFRENAKLKKALDDFGTELKKLDKEVENRSREVSALANVVQDDELWNDVKREIYEVKDLVTKPLDDAIKDVETALKELGP